MPSRFERWRIHVEIILFGEYEARKRVYDRIFRRTLAKPFKFDVRVKPPFHKIDPEAKEQLAELLKDV